jgi:hypothetical protein
VKTYVTSTGAVFGLVTVAHVWRVIEEGPRLLTDPLWVSLTAAAAGLCLWAVRLLWLARRT